MTRNHHNHTPPYSLRPSWRLVNWKINFAKKATGMKRAKLQLANSLRHEPAPSGQPSIASAPNLRSLYLHQPIGLFAMNKSATATAKVSPKTSCPNSPVTSTANSATHTMALTQLINFNSSPICKSDQLNVTATMHLFIFLCVALFPVGTLNQLPQPSALTPWRLCRPFPHKQTQAAKHPQGHELLQQHCCTGAQEQQGSTASPDLVC